MQKPSRARKARIKTFQDASAIKQKKPQKDKQEENTSK